MIAANGENYRDHFQQVILSQILIISCI